MAKVQSISAKEITSAVRKAVAKNETLRQLTSASPGIATIKPPILGLLIRDVDLKDSSIGELNQLAADVAKSLPAAKGAQPAALVHGGHIIIGFIQESAVTLFKE
ncbi:hypothetical protein [Bradyrhizobium roseum]|uniref:hypothetical protein n=1 Tax=Bradyrhizobium roseum TaxID=3056648 RepID=UPI002616751F|nr:hypothetical protein [Bradyrhizobium roseus]WKA31325.1 hypothetical protein QUH67_14675 [Bradyrhizobium roseus]